MKWNGLIVKDNFVQFCFISEFCIFAFALFKIFRQHFGLVQISEILDLLCKSDGERQNSQYRSYQLTAVNIKYHQSTFVVANKMLTRLTF
jgi:hypothetical protein